MKKSDNTWPVKPLGEIAKFINGKAFKPNDWQRKGLPIIRIQNLTGFSDIYNYYNDEIEEKYIVRENDILISWSASLGVYIWNGENAVLNQHIFKVKLNENINGIFFYYLIKTKIDEMLKQVHGSTMKHITKDRFENIKVPIPPLLTQNQIADILEKADKTNQKRKEADKLIDEYLKSLFIEMFGDPVKNPKNWEVKTIKDIVSNSKHSIKAGPFGSSLKKEIYVKTGYKIYGQEQVIRNDLSYGDYFITPNKYKEFENYAIKEGDILISLVGTYGSICIVPRVYIQGIINPRLVKLSLNQKIIEPIFFKYLFLSNSFFKYVSYISHGGTMDILNLAIIKELNVVIPPLSLQNQFIDIVNKVEVLKEKQKQTEQELNNLFQALLQKAFNGGLKIPTPIYKLDTHKNKQVSTTDLHAGIIGKIMHAHAINNKYNKTLGHVKAEKICHIIETEKELDLGRTPARIAAGPADFNHLTKVEHRARMKNWFTVQKRGEQPGYKYIKGKSFDYLLKNTSSQLGDIESEVDEIINKFLPLDTHQSEVVATVYAAWNDLLLEGKNPTDDEIIQEARENWTPEKLKIEKIKFKKSIDWLRRNDLFPKGWGKLTISK